MNALHMLVIRRRHDAQSSCRRCGGQLTQGGYWAVGWRGHEKGVAVSGASESRSWHGHRGETLTDGDLSRAGTPGHLCPGLESVLDDSQLHGDTHGLSRLQSWGLPLSKEKLRPREGRGHWVADLGFKFPRNIRFMPKASTSLNQGHHHLNSP